MKKLFLSLIMLLPVINPALGMEEDGDHQAPCAEASLGVAALNAIANHLHAGNTQLVRSIAREWLEQNPNGTYREFLDEYTQRRSLPAQVLPAIRAGFELISLLRQSNMVINEMVRCYQHDEFNIWSLRVRLDNLCGGSFLHEKIAPWNAQYAQRVIFQHLPKRLHYYGEEGYSSIGRSAYHEIWRMKPINGEKLLPNIGNLFEDTRRRVECCQHRLEAERSGQALPPVLLGIVIWHPDHHSDNFCANKKKLLEAVHNAQQPHHTVAVLLVNGDTRHIIIAHRDIVAVVPSIVIPVGASKDQCRQIAQDAIAPAINRQPVFRTILEAVQYLEGSDS